VSGILTDSVLDYRTYLQWTNRLSNKIHVTKWIINEKLQDIPQSRFVLHSGSDQFWCMVFVSVGELCLPCDERQGSACLDDTSISSFILVTSISISSSNVTELTQRVSRLLTCFSNNALKFHFYWSDVICLLYLLPWDLQRRKVNAKLVNPHNISNVSDAAIIGLTSYNSEDQ
jgi:hypothetical protein